MKSDIYCGAIPYALPIESLGQSVYCASFASKEVFRLQRAASDYYMFFGAMCAFACAMSLLLWIISSDSVLIIASVKTFVAGAGCIAYGRWIAGKGTLGEGVYCVKMDVSRKTAAVHFYRSGDLRSTHVLGSSAIDLRIAPCPIINSNSRWHACAVFIQGMRCILACHQDLNVVREYARALPGGLSSLVRDSDSEIQIRASRKLF